MGHAEGNPGPGGWGVYCENDHRELRGYSAQTTNNPMELQAVIRAFDLIENAPAEDDLHRLTVCIQWYCRMASTVESK